MGIRIVYSRIAKQDLKEIYNYIGKDSLFYAKKEVNSIRSAIRVLESNNLLGKKFEKSDNELTRAMVYKNYQIVYDIISDNQLLILTIHHHARLITNNPAFKDEE